MPGKKKNVNSYTAADLLLGRNIEIIAAALLITGKMRVRFVTIHREEPRVDALISGNLIQPNSGNSNMNIMKNFLKDNGDMTVNEIVEAIDQRINE